jgi:hypothetical protein
LEEGCGRLPQNLEERLAACSRQYLKSLAVSLLDATSLDELFACAPFPAKTSIPPIRPDRRD